jgi:hypothetical protein
VGVLYHDLVLPGEVFHRETGAVHFTIRARINHGGHDDTNVLREGVVPVVGATAISALTLGGVGAALAPAVVAGGLMAVDGLLNTDMSSGGWYAGKRHELEIRGGGNERFTIFNRKTKESYNV